MSLCKCEEAIAPDEPLWIVPVVESDLSEARQNRIKRAYNEKVEQLAPWKRDWNARTVLILETIHGPIQLESRRGHSRHREGNGEQT
jgi:hypothetical protein